MMVSICTANVQRVVSARTCAPSRKSATLSMFEGESMRTHGMNILMHILETNLGESLLQREFGPRPCICTRMLLTTSYLIYTGVPMYISPLDW